MKTKFLTVLLAIAMIATMIASMAVTTFAEDVVTPTEVYVSDNGDDANNGLTSASPVKTLKQAVVVLGDDTANGKVIIVDTFTLDNSWNTPAAKKIVIEGSTSAASLILGSPNRWGYAPKSDLTIQNCTISIASSRGDAVSFFANGHILEMGEGLTMSFSNAEKHKINLAVTAGGTTSTNGTIIVRSGEYNIVGGALKIGTNDYKILATANIAVYGGTINTLQMGSETVDSAKNANYWVFGGTIETINCQNVIEKATLNVSAYTTATTEWISTHVINVDTAKTTVITSENANQVFVSTANGLDTNDGKTIATAVQTIKTAATKITAGGTIYIVDKVDYVTADWSLPGSPTNYTIAGLNLDGSSTFFHNRSLGITFGANITVDNLTIETGAKNLSFYSPGRITTFTDSVTMKPYNDGKDGASDYPTLYAGRNNNFGTESAPGTNGLNIYGGTFNYVVGGCTKTSTGECKCYANATINIGGKANILGNLYLASDTDSLYYGNINVNISGGTIGGDVKVSSGTVSTITGNVTILVTGGTFGKLWDGSTNVTGVVTVNVEALKDSKDNDWIAGKILGTNAVIVRQQPEQQTYDAKDWYLPADFTGKNFVYISDNGKDSNDGKTIDKPVQTYAAAQAIIGEAAGYIVIVDTYTYPLSGAFNMPYTKDASYTIMGAKKDGTSVFGHSRGNISMTNPITFDNLVYQSNVTSGNLYANFNRLEFTDKVVGKLNGNAEATAANRSATISVYGGQTGVSGKVGQKCELILNGGTFNWVVGACQNAENNASVSITVGGNALILNRIYAGCMGTSCDVMETLLSPYDIEININGGTIIDWIYCGGCASSADGGNYVSVDVKVTVKGGTFAGINCLGTYSAPVNGQVIIDFTNYAAATDAEWVKAHIKNETGPQKGLVITPNTLNPFYEEVTTVVEEATTAPEEATTVAEETTVAEKQTEAKTEAKTEAQVVEEKKGCGSAMISGAVILTVSIFGMAWASKKKED